MKIAVICTSDTIGGAAISTTRLTNALSKHGAEAQLIVLKKGSKNLRVEEAGGDFEKKLAFYTERLKIYLNNGFSRKNLFKVSTASDGIKLADNPTVKEADAIILSWINQGMLSLAEIQRIIKTGKPVIWLMHDMWCFTGICHHAFGCDGYKHECGECKFLKGKKNDLSHKVWLKKNKIYSDSKIHFVAVSNWLKEKALASELLREMPVEVIPNAFPVEEYTLPETVRERNKIIMVAERLDDTVKGLGYAIEALNILAEKHPEIAQKYEMVFVGEIRDNTALNTLKFPYKATGRISNSKKLKELYSQSAVIISSSLYETLGGTLIEGEALGAIPVSFGEGGQRDIIEDGKTGYIAKYKDSADLADCIVKALESHIKPKTLHSSVLINFSEENIAKAYISLINKLLRR